MNDLVRNKAVWLVLGIVGLVALAFALRSYQSQQAQTTTGTASQPIEQTTPVALKSIDEILTLAATDTGSSAVVNIEVELEDGQTLYKLVLANGQILFFNAATGVKVVRSDESPDEADDELLKKAALTPGQTLLSFDQARERAAAVRPVAIRKVELENDGGVILYRFKFVDEGVLELDARDGRVVYRKDPGQDEQKFGDDDFDDDLKDNPADTDDDNDDLTDDKDKDDDGDKIEDDKDDDDDNDRVDDKDDDDKDEDDEGKEENR
ncbi:MAG: PepSY domain-containing protein [Patescibacteria group bacterium]